MMTRQIALAALFFMAWESQSRRVQKTYQAETEDRNDVKPTTLEMMSELLQGPDATAWQAPMVGNHRNLASKAVNNPTRNVVRSGLMSGYTQFLDSAHADSRPALRTRVARMQAPATLEKPSASSTEKLEQYVKDKGGKRVIKKILIANNGMAATKAIMSMRNWAYMNFGDGQVLEFVAMATPEDLNANAEFIRLANSYVEVPGGVNRNNYANVDLIVKTAQEQGVDGVWPGWGHASENPDLPDKLNACGIKFIGPTGSVMSVLGDKIAANILAQTAKVPSIPWSGDGLEAELTEDGRIPEDTFNKAMVTSEEQAVEVAKKVGYPIMLKASEGGGGKGIRMSDNEEQLRASFMQVVNEVPGSPMFMMQLCTQARHIEVQVVGDEWGNAVALNGRDCSTQRRFQKIFEEGPPTIVPRATFREMEKAAQRLVQSIGYQGAGTVEYLYNAADDKFYFLELNPRLQVEHPVTEGISGVNMPATQLQVAMGISLDRIPQVREFEGADPEGPGGDIDFFHDYEYPKKHVIAARITAENPDEGFKPTSGSIERVKFQPSTSVWGYFSVGANGGIHEYADSQFGHLFASGKDREEARKNLVIALKNVEVSGEIRTTVEYLVQLLETKEFKENTIDTAWLDGIIKEKSVKTVDQLKSEDIVVGAIVARAHARIIQEEAAFIESLKKGQVSLQPLLSMGSFPMDLTYEDTKYNFQVTRTSATSMRLTINGVDIDVSLREQPDKSLLVSFGGKQRRLIATEEALGLRMSLDGTTVLLPTVYDPSELRTDVTGKVVRYLFEEGEQVEAGQPFVEVEAMKMIMPLRATESGSISPTLSPGSIVSAGDLLASLELKDPSKAKQIMPFTGELTLAAAADEVEDDTFTGTLERLQNVLSGFDDDYSALVPTLLSKASDTTVAVDGIVGLLRKYYDVESKFASAASRDAAVGELMKVNKETLGTVLDYGRSHIALKVTTKLAASLLRLLSTVPESDVPKSAELNSVLADLATLPGKSCGEVALLAASISREMSVAPFADRMAALKESLLSNTDRDALAKSSALSVGVELLTPLFSDSDADVRRAALEVYVRRSYRSYNIKDMEVDAENGVVKWSFQFRDTPAAESPVRLGYLKILPGVEALNAAAVSAANTDLVERSKGGPEMVNVVHFVCQAGDATETEFISSAESLLTGAAPELRKALVSDVNVLVGRKEGQQPSYSMFVASDGYKEDPLCRDLRPAYPQLLELNRLEQNFELQRLDSIGRNTQVYLGMEKQDPMASKGRKRPQPQSVFLRSVSYSSDLLDPEGSERLLAMALEGLERALLNPKVAVTASSRLFVTILPEVGANNLKEVVVAFQKAMTSLKARYAAQLIKLKVDEIEVRVAVALEGEAGLKPVRLMASSMSGEWLRLDSYLEEPDPVTGVSAKFCMIDSDGSKDESMCVVEPYPTSNLVQMKRSNARRVGTTYAYDFLGLFETGLLKVWSEYAESLGAGGATVPATPEDVFQATELALVDGKLQPSTRLVGTNDVGMLAWECVLKTPQYPEGREIVLIANDLTFQSGSFGVKEDDVFKAASALAREKGIPRVYLSSNSGARIGLVEELKPLIQVEWKDPANPAQGFDYLYLSKEDYASLPEGSVVAHEAKPGQMALDAIVGKVHGIGVENLRGSGMIAGETSQAYAETFTLSYVTGRSVGIGAYLMRLGQRNIQMKVGPMLLTGFGALNKLLGNEVYTSNDQLGGPEIMYPNGVSHQLADDDEDGVAKILQWLSFVPKDMKSMPSRIAVADSPEREIGFMPTKTPYDPRNMLAGKTHIDGSFVPGFFDSGSFTEYLGGWGKSVVAGRATLGGIPMGVIAVETRAMENRVPADPADPESRENVRMQAGQVWYPDSAFKTAQAIRDFKGERLPVMVFANWRGFSGGTRDMYDEVLKFGAMIVDALREHDMPVFVYIPPNGELRGGAWVVIDPTINPRRMEMYADAESRGGILEPPGIVEIKFRADDQKKVMHRLDGRLQQLDSELSGAPEEKADKLQHDIKEREDNLLPYYGQVAVEFADLHDRSGRMLAKGVIRDSVEWPKARSYFYWRLRRRLAEDAALDKVGALDESAVEQLASVLDELRSSAGIADDDKSVAEWIEGAGAEQVAASTKEVATLAAQRRIDALQASLASM